MQRLQQKPLQSLINLPSILTNRTSLMTFVSARIRFSAEQSYPWEMFSWSHCNKMREKKTPTKHSDLIIIDLQLRKLFRCKWLREHFSFGLTTSLFQLWLAFGIDFSFSKLVQFGTVHLHCPPKTTCPTDRTPSHGTSQRKTP